MRRNPSPAWFKELQLARTAPGQTEYSFRRDEWSLAAARAIVERAVRLAAQVGEDGYAPDRRKREIAARLALLRASAMAVRAARPWDTSGHSGEDAAAHTLDVAAHEIGVVADAEAEILRGEYRGAVRHTVVRDGVSAEHLRDLVERAEDLSALRWADQLSGQLLMLQHEIRAATDDLVGMDPSTYESLTRRYTAAEVRTVRELNLSRRGRTPRRALSREEIDRKVRAAHKSRYQFWLDKR